MLFLDAIMTAECSHNVTDAEADSCSDLQARTQALNEECCNEPGEDCSSGRPASCNAGCARVVLPFFDDCGGALGPDAAQFDNVYLPERAFVLETCRAAVLF